MEIWKAVCDPYSYQSPATHVKLPFRADEPFLPPWTEKRSEMEARHSSLPSPAAPECTQQPFPAPDARSCSCFFLPGNPQSEPKQLANDDVFPNGIHTEGCLLSLGSYCQMHLLSYASSQCRSWIHSHKIKLSITHAQHREDCEF